MHQLSTNTYNDFKSKQLSSGDGVLIKFKVRSFSSNLQKERIPILQTVKTNSNLQLASSLPNIIHLPNCSTASPNLSGDIICRRVVKLL